MDQAQNLREIVKNNAKANARQKSKIITVTSGKGGVGKTSVSINMAIQFRRQGKSVIIFDADFGLANIEVMFGAIPKYNLSD
ncbi:MAG: P-loop NTPase, partial [Lachnospiraceae bacterium]|nr:P-loop NTPase [Lachnospiraceae bacterium]